MSCRIEEQKGREKREREWEKNKKKGGKEKEKKGEGEGGKKWGCPNRTRCRSVEARLISVLIG